MNEYEYKISLAGPDEADEAMELYRSIIGTPGCVWDETYPSMEEVAADIAARSLFIMRDASGKLAAAAGLARDDEQLAQSCWNGRFKNPCELFRVGVRRDLQRRGLGRMLVSEMTDEAARRGHDGLLLLALKTNQAAVSLYSGLGFSVSGECELYGYSWYCMEKKLS